MSRKSANLSKSKAQSVKLAQYLGFFMVGYSVLNIKML